MVIVRGMRKTTVTAKTFQQGVIDCDDCYNEMQPGDEYFTDGCNILCKRCFRR